MKVVFWFYGVTCLLTAMLVSCNKPDHLFVSVPASQTNIHFTNTPVEEKAFGILYYLYYYNGGGVAIGDINNDGLPDIYFTANHHAGNRLYLNKGNFQFEDVTAKAGVAGNADWCSGVTMADVNGDGFLDIYVCAINMPGKLKGSNELFINNHDGTFRESAAAYGLDFSGLSTQAAFFDYDHDGDLDCYLLNQSARPNANITDTSNRRKYSAVSGDRLYRNNLQSGAEKFTDVSATAGIYQSNLGYGLGLAVADLNNDGWDDIYVGNDFHENDYYYVNNGNGSFRESGAGHFRHYSRFSMGNDIADFNNDAQPDVVTVDMLPPDEKVLKTYGSDENPEIYNFKITRNGFQYQYSRNCLQLNNGNGNSFSEVGLLSGISATDWSWSPLFADFDNDGKKDLFISSGIVKRPVDLDYVKFISNLYASRGVDKTDEYDQSALEKMPDGVSHPFLYHGTAGLKFEDVSAQWGLSDLKGYSNGAAYADLDNDGRLDLVINCLNSPALILKNNAPLKNFLSLTFEGTGLNKKGIGAKAYLFGRDRVGRREVQFQELMLTRGFQSSSDSRLHFGLDSLKAIDSFLIVWPGQQFQLIKNVTANQSLTIHQTAASGTFNYNEFFPPVVPVLLPAPANETVSWRHHENNFTDFSSQYLIPHEESTRGPRIAVADVNKDGMEDFYVCGGRGQPGALMVRTRDGSFRPGDTATFNADHAFEGVAAVFFDANGDGYPDLYVVSGGNEFSGADDQLKDRLYLNNGAGHFVRSLTSLPEFYGNKSCVTVADIDHDGDLDIFSGNLVDANAYGLPQTSFLLLNDGKANFSLASSAQMQLGNLGMVTDAVFADINKDGWPDLVVAGEWMPLTIFINNKGTFEKTVLPNSSGWWQRIMVADADGDGNADIIAGNWGWNNKFESGKDGPLRLYVSDFDGNGKVDQLLSYMQNGTEYPFLAKDEVERALPLLKKHYLLYADYAAVPMKKVFYGWIDTVKPLLAERLGSAICYGNGNGQFRIDDLPASLQEAPVFSFLEIEHQQAVKTFLTGGNFFGVTPYEGRYDAQALGLFSTAAASQMTSIHQQNLLDIPGEVRDLQWLHATGKQDLLVVARNNDSLLFFQANK